MGVRRKLFLLLGMLVLVAPVHAEQTESYFGIYLKSKKIGRMLSVRDDQARLAGKRCVKSTTTSRIQIGLLGTSSEILTKSVIYADSKTGATLREESRIETSGRVTDVTANFSPTSVSYVAFIQGTKKSGKLTLPIGSSFLVDPSEAAGAIKPVPGAHYRGKIFLTDTLQLIDGELTVGNAETIALGGQIVSAYKLSMRSLVPSTSYVSASGELLRMLVPPGVEMVREPKKVAMLPFDNKDFDLSKVLGITPTGVTLDEPRASTRAVYELRGVTSALAPSDTVQQWTQTDAPEKTVRVTVTTGPLPESAGMSRFLNNSTAPKELAPFLKSTEYVPADDPSFRRLALSIIEGETDLARASEKLAVYVHKTIAPDPSIAAVRTARDIQRDPRGVCRDYTTYFTTLARAVGIPTKQCVGLAYVNEQFLYHAWPEVWVGGNRWVALEPTWGKPFADATHLKLAEGEILDVMKISGDMENYAIKVIEIK